MTRLTLVWFDLHKTHFTSSLSLSFSFPVLTSIHHLELQLATKVDLLTSYIQFQIYTHSCQFDSMANTTGNSGEGEGTGDGRQSDYGKAFADMQKLLKEQQQFMEQQQQQMEQMRAQMAAQNQSKSYPSFNVDVILDSFR